MGFGVWGLGFGVWGLGFGVWGLGFGVWGLGFGVWGLGFGVWGWEARLSATYQSFPFPRRSTFCRTHLILGASTNKTLVALVICWFGAYNFTPKPARLNSRV